MTSPAPYDQMVAMAESGWAALREAGPVVFREEGIYGVPAYYVTRRDDILSALLDTEKLARVDDLFPPQYRDITEPLLVPAALNGVPAELRRRAAAVIETATAMTVAGREVTPADVGEAFAEQVFLALCGIERDHELPQAIADRRTPFLAALADQLDDAKVVDAVHKVIEGGFIGVALATQFALVNLLNDAELAGALRTDPQRITEFVDDLFRNRSPIPAVVRRATTDTTIAGVDIPEGAQVELCIGALGRSPGHLEFGAGQHRCIGRHLSTLALCVFVQEWVHPVP